MEELNDIITHNRNQQQQQSLPKNEEEINKGINNFFAGVFSQGKSKHLAP